MPVLTLLFNVQAQVAVSTSLAAIIPTTISASISHYRHGNLNISVGILLGIGGIMGAWLGTYISSLMSPNLLQKVFGVFMLLMGIQMSFSAKKRLRGGTNRFQANKRVYDCACPSIWASFWHHGWALWTQRKPPCHCRALRFESSC